MEPPRKKPKLEISCPTNKVIINGKKKNIIEYCPHQPQSNNAIFYKIEDEPKFIIKEFRDHEQFSKHEIMFNKFTNNDFICKHTLVPMQIIKKVDGTNVILMNKYKDDIFELMQKHHLEPILVKQIVELIISNTRCLFENGLYYTDLKLENILYRFNEKKEIEIVFGDVESIFDLDTIQDNNIKHTIESTSKIFCYLLANHNMMFTIDEIKRLVIYALGISIFTFYIYSYEELTCPDQMKSIKISLDVIQRCDYKKLGTLGFFEKEQKKFELTKHMHNICNRAKEISPQNQDMEYYYKIFYYCTIFALHNTVDDTFFSVLETHLEKIEVQNA